MMMEGGPTTTTGGAAAGRANYPTEGFQQHPNYNRRLPEANSRPDGWAQQPQPQPGHQPQSQPWHQPQPQSWHQPQPQSWQQQQQQFSKQRRYDANTLGVSPASAYQYDTASLAGSSGGSTIPTVASQGQVDERYSRENWSAMTHQRGPMPASPEAVIPPGNSMEQKYTLDQGAQTMPNRGFGRPGGNDTGVHNRSELLSDISAKPQQRGQPLGSTVAPPRSSGPSTLTQSSENRIDPANIPRPVANEELLAELGGTVWETGSLNMPPPASHLHTYVDKGDATPRFIRCTMNTIPNNKQTLTTCAMPLGVVITPFPLLGVREGQIPKTDLTSFSPVMQQISSIIPGGGGGSGNVSSDSKYPKKPTEGPLRCPACGAYGNPHFEFTSSSALCNFCGEKFQLPDYYALALNEYRTLSLAANKQYRTSASGYDMAVAQKLADYTRPEICVGTVDFCMLPRGRPQSGGGGVLAPPGDNGTSRFSVPSEAIPTSSEQLFSNLSTRPVGRLGVVFVVDSSSHAVEFGWFDRSLHAIKEATLKWPEDCAIDIALLTVSSQINFYVFSGLGSAFRVHVIGDHLNPFVPAPSKLLFQATGSPSFEEYMERIRNFCAESNQVKQNSNTNSFDRFLPSLSSNIISLDTALAAIRCAQLLLKERQGSEWKVENPIRGGIVVSLLGGPFPAQRGLNGGALAPPNMTKTGGASSVGAASTKKQQQLSGPYQPDDDYEAVVDEIVEDAVQNAVSHEILAIGPSFETLYGCDGAGGPTNSGGRPQQQQMLETVKLNSLWKLAQLTGGRCVYHHGGSLEGYYEEITNDIARLIKAPFGHDCVFKIRTSKNLQVTRILCPWSHLKTESGGHGANATSFVIPHLNCDTAICFEMTVVDGRSEKFCYIQAACMYTNRSGERLLRTFTLRLNTTNTLLTIFRHGDVEALATLMTRRAALAILSDNLKWREDVTATLVNIFFAYRFNLAINSPSGQLVLPESIKFLPVYLTGLYKNIAVRTMTTSRDSHHNERIATMMKLLSSTTSQLCDILYPKLYMLFRSSGPFLSSSKRKVERVEKFGLPTGIENFCVVPPSIATSGENVSVDGIFLLDNGFHRHIYFGAKVPEEVLNDIFAQSVNTSITAEAKLQEDRPGSFGQRILAVVRQIDMEKFDGGNRPIRIVPPSSIEESKFIWFMVEDRLGSEPSYIDFLCQVHKRVGDLLAEM